MKVLITDGLAPEGLAHLRTHAEVAAHQGLTPEDLRAAIADADAVVVRSRTRIDEELLTQARKLRVIARAGVGVDNMDVEAATRRGILVLNAPDSSTISTAEHTMAMILALVRHLPAAHLSTSKGEWQRDRFTGVELYGKTLGIIGLGKIGSEVARRASAFGVRVVAFDPYVSAERAARCGAELIGMGGRAGAERSPHAARGTHTADPPPPGVGRVCPTAARRVRHQLRPRRAGG